MAKSTKKNNTITLDFTLAYADYLNKYDKGTMIAPKDTVKHKMIRMWNKLKSKFHTNK